LLQESTAISKSILPRERELCLEHAQWCRFLFMEESCGHLAVEIVPEMQCDFSTCLAKRARAQTGACAEVQFLDYGRVLWSSCSKIIPGKHCDFSTYLTKRAIAQSVACAEVQFPDNGTFLWSPGSRNFSRKARKHCDFSTYLTKRVRAQFGACAVVQFPDNGTELWSPGSRIVPRNAQRFQHLSCQVSESSVWSMRRGAVS
jgi:hypothetical protein